MGMHCNHCDRLCTSRAPRGLCWYCFHIKGVREVYPKTPNTGDPTRYKDAISNERPMPVNPTSALPGSKEKLDILISRAQAGHHLWHPLDVVGYGSLV